MLNERGACGEEMHWMIMIMLYIIGTGVIGCLLALIFLGVCTLAEQLFNVDIPKKMKDKWGGVC